MFGHSFLELLIIEILVVTLLVHLDHVDLFSAFYVFTELLFVQLQRRLARCPPARLPTAHVQNVEQTSQTHHHQQDVDDDWPAYCK